MVVVEESKGSRVQRTKISLCYSNTSLTLKKVHLVSTLIKIAEDEAVASMLENSMLD